MAYRGKNTVEDTFQTWNGSTWIPIRNFQVAETGTSRVTLNTVENYAGQLELVTQGSLSNSGITLPGSVADQSGGVNIFSTAQNNAGRITLSVNCAGNTVNDPGDDSSILQEISAGGDGGKMIFRNNCGGVQQGFLFESGAGNTSGDFVIQISGGLSSGNILLNHNGSTTGPGRTVQTVAASAVTGSLLVQSLGYG